MDRQRLLFVAALVAWTTSLAAAQDPLRPLTADEIATRDRIRQGLLGNDPEGERAAIEARLSSQTFETPKELERRTAQAGGREREYFVFVPEKAKGKPSPVVFALHGAGASSGLAQHWKSDYTGLAAEEGFVVVYPSGVRGWNWSPGGPSGPRDEVSEVNDLAFFDAMFDALIADGVADPKRIYVTGGSGGGFMTFALMYHRGARIAAVGIVVGLLPKISIRWEVPPPLMPTLLMLGTVDPLVTWDGSPRGYSAAETVKELCRLNGCTGEPQLAMLPDRDSTDGVTVEIATWSGKAPIVLYRMNGAGHGWPMTKDTKSGPKSQDFVPIEAFWPFLSEHSLPH